MRSWPFRRCVQSTAAIEVTRNSTDLPPYGEQAQKSYRNVIMLPFDNAMETAEIVIRMNLCPHSLRFSRFAKSTIIGPQKTACGHFITTDQTMGVVKLSRMFPMSLALSQPQRTVGQQDTLLEQKKLSLPGIIILLTKCLLPPLLVFALIITLISLLLPTVEHHGTTFYSIQPVGYARKVTIGSLPISSTSTSLSALSGSALAAIGDIEQKLEGTSIGNNVVNTMKVIVQSGNVTLEKWLGIDGPSIFVGALSEEIYSA